MKKRLPLIIFAAYIIFNAVLLYFHEPWRDEAQVWLLSRDIKFYNLPAQMHYEGHSCLWHFMIYIFAHFRMPYILQSLTAFTVTSAAAAILLFKGPFPLYFKSLVVFSPLFTYYYPVIARTYCIIPLTLMGAAYMYNKRWEKGCLYCTFIALLVHTHVIMIMAAFLMSLFYMAEGIILTIRDKSGARGLFKRFIPLFIPLASAIFWLWQTLYDIGESSLLIVRTASFQKTVGRMVESLVKATGGLTGMGEGKKTAVILCLFLVFFVIYIVDYLKPTIKGDVETKPDPAETASNPGEQINEDIIPAHILFITVFTATLIFQLWFYAMIYAYSTQKFLSLPLLILWGLYITRSGKHLRVRRFAFAMFCVLCMVAALKGDIRDNIKRPYSNSRFAAEFIKTNIADYTDCVFITDNEPEVTAIFPYLDPVKAVYAPNGIEFSYVTWDKHWNERGVYEDLKGQISYYRNQGKRVYIISCPERSYIEENFYMDRDYELLYESPGDSIKGEDYKIYKIS